MYGSYPTSSPGRDNPSAPSEGAWRAQLIHPLLWDRSNNEIIAYWGQLIALSGQHRGIISIGLHRMARKLLCPSSPVAYKVDQIISEDVVCSECDDRCPHFPEKTDALSSPCWVNRELVPMKDSKEYSVKCDYSKGEWIVSSKDWYSSAGPNFYSVHWCTCSTASVTWIQKCLGSNLGYIPWWLSVCPLSYTAGLVCILYGLLEGPGELSILGKMEVSFIQYFFS